MDFDKQKKDVLNRLDKSQKGSIDKPIKKLVDLLNSLPEYYTSSSCSGRILLIERAESGKKEESKWIFIKHSKVNFKEIKTALSNISKKPIWLKQEPMIIHICCRDLESARKLLVICQQAGLKRSGIVALGKRIMIEVFGTERIDTIVADEGKIFVSDDYIEVLVKEANKKHEKNIERINKLYNSIIKLKEN